MPIFAGSTHRAKLPRRDVGNGPPRPAHGRPVGDGAAWCFHEGRELQAAPPAAEAHTFTAFLIFHCFVFMKRPPIQYPGVSVPAVCPVVPQHWGDFEFQILDLRDDQDAQAMGCRGKMAFYWLFCGLPEKLAAPLFVKQNSRLTHSGGRGRESR